jgi:hypothetical protein
MADKVRVVSKGADGKVLLWEGDTFLSNDGIEREVELTPAVQRLIASGDLVEVKGKGKAKKDVPPLRPATNSEEDAAGLEGSVERDTARVPVVPEDNKE